MVAQPSSRLRIIAPIIPTTLAQLANRNKHQFEEKTIINNESK
jgi:hypothetical protein